MTTNEKNNTKNIEPENCSNPQKCSVINGKGGTGQRNTEETKVH